MAVTESLKHSVWECKYRCSDTLVYEFSPRLVLGENDLDEYYSLGAISAVRFLDDGRIAVLDRFAYGARIYSPSGEYLQTIGGQGEGPGEFCNPNSMAALNDRIVIIDKWALRATLFDQQGRYIDELTDSWSFTPPSFIHMASDSFLIGGVTTMDGSEGVTTVDYMVNVMNMSFEVVDTLFLNHFIFQAGNATQMLQMSLFSVSHTTDGKGNMFVAEASPESCRIEGWNLAGENFTTITREFDPVEKTPQEITRESERISRMIEARNPGMRHTYTPIQYRNQISPNGVHADGLGRLWVLRGLSDQRVFDVYSYSGELLSSTIMQGIDIPMKFKKFSGGMFQNMVLPCFRVIPGKYPWCGYTICLSKKTEINSAEEMEESKEIPENHD